MKTRIVLFSAAYITILSGCASYRHERTSPNGTTEVTVLRAPWLTKNAVAGLKTRVTDYQGTNKYTRSVGLESGTNSGDPESIDALSRLIGSSVESAIKATKGVPTPIK